MERTKKTLKFLSRLLAGLFFTLAFFLLFVSVFGTGLIEGLPVLESSLQEKILDPDFILSQVAQQSGLTPAEIKEACRQSPNQEGCEQINNPGSLATPIIAQIQDQIGPYKPFINNLTAPMAILFILSLIFYFFGTFSVYAALFKISINAFISSVFGYIAFSSLPKLIPGIIDQALKIAAADVSDQLPTDFKTNLIDVMNTWMQAPLSELNSLLTYLIAISLLSSILFYFLKRKQGKLTEPKSVEGS
jgi:hypothetical protein